MQMQQQALKKRIHPRTEVQSYHCIEVQTLKMSVKYQFKIWNSSSHGICILVKKDSDFLNKVTVGEILDVNYCHSDFSQPPDVHQTKIMHITKAKHDKFKNHCFVGLMVIGSSLICVELHESHCVNTENCAPQPIQIIPIREDLKYN